MNTTTLATATTTTAKSSEDVFQEILNDLIYDSDNEDNQQQQNNESINELTDYIENPLDFEEELINKDVKNCLNELKKLCKSFELVEFKIKKRKLDLKRRYKSQIIDEFLNKEQDNQNTSNPFTVMRNSFTFSCSNGKLIQQPSPDKRILAEKHYFQKIIEIFNEDTILIKFYKWMDIINQLFLDKIANLNDILFCNLMFHDKYNTNLFLINVKNTKKIRNKITRFLDKINHSLPRNSHFPKYDDYIYKWVVKLVRIYDDFDLNN